MLHSTVVVALIRRVVRPNFQARALLQVIDPIAFILAAIDVVVSAIAVRFIVLPLTAEHVPIHMVESTIAMSFILMPGADVLGSVWPRLLTLTMLKSF